MSIDRVDLVKRASVVKKVGSLAWRGAKGTAATIGTGVELGLKTTGKVAEKAIKLMGRANGTRIRNFEESTMKLVRKDKNLRQKLIYSGHNRKVEATRSKFRDMDKKQRVSYVKDKYGDKAAERYTRAHNDMNRARGTIAVGVGAAMGVSHLNKKRKEKALRKKYEAHYSNLNRT